jgi:hypothetical protein
MPWLPELFSEPVLQRVLDQRHVDEVVAMSFFDGVLSGEQDALLDSFAGEPAVHDPVRGHITGRPAFTAYLDDLRAWLAQRNVTVEDVSRVILSQHGFEEVVLHVDHEGGRRALPFALVADHRSEGRIDELRLYYSARPLTGRHEARPAFRSPDPGLRVPALVAEQLRALAAGDVDAAVAVFAPDGCAHGPAGDVHRGADGLRTYYARLLARGGVPVEPCALVDDGRICALEYNVVGWGGTPRAPQAGVAMYVRGGDDRLAALRAYDDVAPPSPER